METRHTHSAGGVILDTKGQVLIVDQYGNSWSLPKGHVEPGEEPLAAAKREIYEESGLKNLTLVKDLGSYERYRMKLGGGDDMSERKHIHLFLFTTDKEIVKPIDPDNHEARWVVPADVPKFLTHKEDRAFFETVLDEIKKLGRWRI